VIESRTQLRLFLHLATSLSFGRTSEECHVSPATLTRRIQRLESDLGCRLFDRGPRGVALTQEGRHFLGYAQRALDLWEQYQRDGGTGPALAGRISIYASVTACQALLPSLLARFRALHPQVHLDLQTGDAASAIARLEEGAADVAVAALPARIPETVVSREIGRTPLRFVGAANCEHDGWTDGPFVLPRHGLARTAADRWLRSHGLHPEIAAEVDGHEALLTLVTVGCGVGIVPELVLECSPLRDQVRVLAADPGPEGFRIGLCVRRADLRRPLVAALWAASSGLTDGPWVGTPRGGDRQGGWDEGARQHRPSLQGMPKPSAPVSCSRDVMSSCTETV
jgi:LysR family transcriptional regulator, positive regulator for ilvC